MGISGKQLEAKWKVMATNERQWKIAGGKRKEKGGKRRQWEAMQMNGMQQKVMGDTGKQWEAIVILGKLTQAAHAVQALQKVQVAQAVKGMHAVQAVLGDAGSTRSASSTHSAGSQARSRTPPALSSFSPPPRHTTPLPSHAIPTHSRSPEPPGPPTAAAWLPADPQGHSAVGTSALQDTPAAMSHPRSRGAAGPPCPHPCPHPGLPPGTYLGCAGSLPLPSPRVLVPVQHSHRGCLCHPRCLWEEGRAVMGDDVGHVGRCDVPMALTCLQHLAGCAVAPWPFGKSQVGVEHALGHGAAGGSVASRNRSATLTSAHCNQMITYDHVWGGESS